MADTIVARIAAGELVLNEMETKAGGVTISTASTAAVTITHGLGRVPKFVMCWGPFVSASNSTIGSGTMFVSCAAMDKKQVKTTATKSSSTAMSAASNSTSAALLTESEGYIQAANEQTFRLEPGSKILNGTLNWVVAG